MSKLSEIGVEELPEKIFGESLENRDTILVREEIFFSMQRALVKIYNDQVKKYSRYSYDSKESPNNQQVTASAIADVANTIKNIDEYLRHGMGNK